MALSMYQASVPVFTRNLKILDDILGQASMHAAKNEIDPAVLFHARLFPNMFPLSRQVQIATDFTLRGSNRLAGEEPKSIPDTETTLDELRARVRQAQEILGGYSPGQIDGSETRKIELKLPTGELKLDGQAFLLNFVLPNFFFHLTTTYNILRHNGVPLGKSDFLGA